MIHRGEQWGQAHFIRQTGDFREDLAHPAYWPVLSRGNQRQRPFYSRKDGEALVRVVQGTLLIIPTRRVWYGVSVADSEKAAKTGDWPTLNKLRKRECEFPFVLAKKEVCRCGKLTAVNLEAHSASGGKEITTPLLTQVYLNGDGKGLDKLLQSGKVAKYL